MEIKIPYYEDNTRISNSSIGWFLKNGPRYFKDRLDGKELGESKKYLDKGTMIHMYILQPEEFSKVYKIRDFKVPVSLNMKNFCSKYVESIELLEEDKLYAAYTESYTTKESKTVVNKKAQALVDEYSDYISFLKDDNSGIKTISFAEHAFLQKIKANLTEHKLANTLLETTGTEIAYNEFHINWEKGDMQMKSLLDRVKIDYVNKTITIIDLKTTANLYDFASSVETYDYYRQLTFYSLAIYWYLEKDQKVDISDFELKLYIVAISSTTGEIKVFNMFNQSIISEKTDLIDKTISEIKYHKDSDNWDHTRIYYEGNGEEEL